LRELNLADSGVEILQGLEKLVALETLDVTRISTTDLSILRPLRLLGETNEALVTLCLHGALPLDR
jgi:hypothetical protein